MAPSPRRLAEISQLAYTDAPTWSRGGVEALRVDLENVHVIAFRGTTFDGLDIIRDLRGLPWWSPALKAWVHSGFLKRFRLAWLSMAADIHRLPMPIIFTGHSKGAAEATLAAAWLRVVDGIEPAGLVTFGSPRVGFGEALERSLDGVYVGRYVNGDDPVPQFPHRLFFRARHVGKWRNIGHPASITGWSVEDHKLQNYIDNL